MTEEVETPSVEASGGTPELIPALAVDEHIAIDATPPVEPVYQRAIAWLENEAALTLKDVKEIIAWAAKKL